MFGCKSSIRLSALVAFVMLAAAPRAPTAEAAGGPGSPMSAPQARAYMLALINRDRASLGLAPVALDEGAATRAGQVHAEDMAAHGYVGHYGSDGSVPEQRFTKAGGVDMVMENASCYSDGRARTLDPAARIDPRALRQTEDAFFHEQPPNDGHRKNILKSWHDKVGIGVAQAAATPSELPVPCVAQEFVDAYGSYVPVADTLKPGATLHVEGIVAPPAAFAGVGVGRVDVPAPADVPSRNTRRSYAIPASYVMYWPAGFVTPIAVRVNSAGHFTIDLPIGEHGDPGLYELSIWARVPGSSDPVMVSLRTVLVR
jgi:uncharacterized protein YkwD